MKNLDMLVNNNKKDEVEDLWMLDYFHKTDCRWVRVPGLTWNQVIRCLNDLSNQKSQNHFKNVMSETFEDIDWSGVRIHSERELDVMVDKDGEEELWNPEDENYKFLPLCTKRTSLFGDNYQNTIALYRKGEEFRSRLTGNIPKHALVDEESLMADLRYMYPGGIDWNEYDAEFKL